MPVVDEESTEIDVPSGEPVPVGFATMLFSKFPDLVRPKIAVLIRSTLRKGTPLPDADAIWRNVDLGQPVDSTLTVAGSPPPPKLR